MDIKIGRVVISKAGRDKGKWMVVTEVLNDRVMVIDGKERPIERPKPKNIKHVALTGYEVSEYDMAANRRLKRALYLLSSKVRESGEEAQQCQNKI